MTTTQAIQILTEYQAWRRGAETPMQDPLTIREAIDKAIEVMKGTLNDGILIDIEQGACGWLKGNNYPTADHWSFKQGAKWIMDKLGNSYDVPSSDCCPKNKS